MNIEHIRTFLEIASTGNFHRAAERLHVTQSTVSARIRSLEDQLDRALFSRNRQGVTLTAAGHHFHRHAVAVVRSWAQARQEVSLPAGFRTSFGFGSTTSLWERLVPRWTSLMRQAAPDVALRLDVDHSESMLHLLADGLLDLAVMYQPRSAPGLLVETLLEERLILVATKDYSVGDDWKDGYVFVDWGYNFRAQHYDAFPGMKSPALTVGLGELGLRHLLDHGGSAYLSRQRVRAYLADQQLTQVKSAPVFKRPAYMVYTEFPADPDIMALAITSLRRVGNTRVHSKKAS